MSPRPKPPSLQAARGESTIGLPLPGNARFRLLKRIIYRLSWPLLSHQIAFNEHVIDTFNQTLDELSRQHDELTKKLMERLEFGLHQAGREIGDHVARTESALASLQMQVAELRQVLSPRVVGGTRTGPESSRAQERDTRP